jgi:hypothetical protein
MHRSQFAVLLIAQPATFAEPQLRCAEDGRDVSFPAAHGAEIYTAGCLVFWFFWFFLLSIVLQVSTTGDLVVETWRTEFLLVLFF